MFVTKKEFIQLKNKLEGQMSAHRDLISEIINRDKVNVTDETVEEPQKLVRYDIFRSTKYLSTIIANRYAYDFSDGERIIFFLNDKIVGSFPSDVSFSEHIDDNSE
jgi:hypothetical protein